MDLANADLSPAQRHVLIALKRQGEATADQLAGELEISASAVRQHLGNLRSAGLVAAQPQRGQPGRPVDRYHATQSAESLFVAPETDLSTELLGYVEAEDPTMVTRVFERRRRHLAEAAADRLDGSCFDDRVRIVTEMLDARGYLADFEQVEAGHYRISLHSCAIWNLASHYRQACTSELELIRDMIPGATVDRVTTKIDGAHSCAYDIKALA